MRSVTIHLEGNRYVIDAWADGSVDVRGWRNSELVPFERLAKLDGKNHWPKFREDFKHDGLQLYHPFTGDPILIAQFSEYVTARVDADLIAH
jgi:hypothetical protein